MKRVLKSFLTVAMATAMVGLAVTQARADRITLKSGCAGVSCSPETLTVSGASMSHVASSLTVDIATENSAALEFVSEVIAGRDLSVASAAAQTSTKASEAPLGVKNSARPRAATFDLLSNSMLWSFGGSHSAMNATQSSASLALPMANGRSGSFSLVAGNVVTTPSIPATANKTGSTFPANGTSEPEPKIVGGPAVPEPTTMLLFGTGLVGAAAVLRKRLRNRRVDSK